MRTTTPNVAVVYATGTGEITNFTGQPMTWTEHLYTRCHTRLTPDAKARGYLHAKTEASREVEVKAAQHRVHAQDAHFDNALAGIRQDGSLARQAAELDALGGRELDARRILMLHLARHPEDTERALDLLLRHEHAQLERAEVRDRRAMELFQFMADRD